MKVLILGAGVVGVTSAYALAKRGYEVEVIERGDMAALETSFANGGQLSYSHAEPWANPGTLPKVFKWMFDDTAPLVMRPRLDWQMVKWGMRFLTNCTQKAADANTLTILKLGLYSRLKTHEIIDETQIEFDYLKNGILHVFCKQGDLDHAIKQVEFQAKYGCEEIVKTLDECLELEPALQHTQYNLIGGIHAHHDESGDIHTFTVKLAEFCAQKYGVKFHYGTSVTQLKKDNQNKIAAVVTDRGEFTADAYVMSLGSYSPIYLRQVGLDIPIYPMKGYSVTFKGNEHSPKLSITDQKAKIVYSPLGNRLRVAGTAEFAGHNSDIKRRRIRPIKKAVRRLFPKVLDDEDPVISEWACLRPSTPDGPPIIGKTPVSNLYMNTGHGTLGWTQAAGSAEVLADIFDGKETAITLDGLKIDRYL